MKKKKPALRSKRAMVHAAFRLKREDRELWREAAIKTGESLTEFLRISLRERARKVLFTAHVNGDSVIP
jgi:uncharacterized protein (DUF1778 family)